VSLFTKPFASGGQSGLFTLSDGRGENLSKDFQFFSRVGLSIPHRQGSLCRREIGRWLSEHNLALINEAATKAGGGSYTDYKLLSVEQDPDEVDRSGLVLWRFNFQSVSICLALYLELTIQADWGVRRFWKTGIEQYEGKAQKGVPLGWGVLKVSCASEMPV